MHASPSELTSPMQIEFAIDIESQSVDITVNHLLYVGWWGMRQYGSSVHVFSSVMGTRSHWLAAENLDVKHLRGRIS